MCDLTEGVDPIQSTDFRFLVAGTRFCSFRKPTVADRPRPEN